MGACCREEERRGGDTYAVRKSKETQIPTPRMMHTKRIWMIQKGMRTDFNQGDDWPEDFAIAAAVDMISSPPKKKKRKGKNQ